MLDIKLKNNRNIRTAITVAVLVLLTVINIFFFPDINRNAQRILNERQQEAQGNPQETNKELLEQFYKGCYVLYLEQAKSQASEIITASELYLKEIDRKDLSGDEEKTLRESSEYQINNALDAWSDDFEQWRSYIDYCIVNADGSFEKNTSQELQTVTDVKDKTAVIQKLQDYYKDYFVLRFDAEGNLNIDPLYSMQVNPDTLIKVFQQIDREQLLADEIGGDGVIFSGPKDFTVVFGIPFDAAEELALAYYNTYNDGYGDYWERVTTYQMMGAGLLLTVSLLIVAILVLVMNSKRIWKEDISFERKGNRYLMEAAGIGVLCIFGMQEIFYQAIWELKDYTDFQAVLNMLKSDNVYNGVVVIAANACYVFAIYAIWYLSLHYIRPVFSLGLKEYIRQYSFIYQIFPWLKKKWDQFYHEVGHIDFSEKSTKIIVKITGINFAVLVLISFLWFFGIGALIVYSFVLFYLIKKYYDKAGRDYQTLLKGVNKIAEGDLDSEIMEDLGMFEPFKAELTKIRAGFKLAVDEEVKSQRMKTELITNVSHDLKTPLTAITTYIELLKKEDITEEERRSYIETIEKKSLRLKVLIEDLFEVSKATSNNIKLDPMEVDVINLMKQVSIEHADKFDAAGLTLLWNVPEEKVVLMLDNQKTYRIFENLFVNALKYAMQGSRVYVDAVRKEDILEIVIKNMSKDPLNVKGEEITERFVRGDSSRNTEGSGLGLAIAKSFTEAQGGNLHVEIDGDLFKVVIRWKCGILYT